MKSNLNKSTRVMLGVLRIADALKRAALAIVISTLVTGTAYAAVASSRNAPAPIWLLQSWKMWWSADPNAALIASFTGLGNAASLFLGAFSIFWSKAAKLAEARHFKRMAQMENSLSGKIDDVGVQLTGVGDKLHHLLENIENESASRRRFFEAVIAPLHRDAELVLSDYYYLFGFIREEIRAASRNSRSLSYDSRNRIEHMYLMRKSKRDEIRTVCQYLSENAGHSRVRKYGASINRIFDPIISVGMQMSVGGAMINIAELCVSEKMNHSFERYDSAAKIQIEHMRALWISSNQLYAILMLDSFGTL